MNDETDAMAGSEPAVREFPLRRARIVWSVLALVFWMLMAGAGTVALFSESSFSWPIAFWTGIAVLGIIYEVGRIPAYRTPPVVASESELIIRGWRSQISIPWTSVDSVTLRHKVLGDVLFVRYTVPGRKRLKTLVIFPGDLEGGEHLVRIVKAGCPEGRFLESAQRSFSGAERDSPDQFG